MGAFANGYPQRTLSDFLSVNLAEYPELAGLTEPEWEYATQAAVWATLGQLAIEDTDFTSGRETIPVPSGNAQKMRVYTAVKIILYNAHFWTKPLVTSMEIRFEKEDHLSNLNIEAKGGIVEAAQYNNYGIKIESRNGNDYYTRTVYVSSATSTFKNDYTIDTWAENAPGGTLFTAEDNSNLQTFERDGYTVYRVPTAERDTSLNDNDSEYWGACKIWIPVNTADANGDITIKGSTTANQYNIYRADNPEWAEQSYIIADPATTPLQAAATLRWKTTQSIYGKLIVEKIDGMGRPLAGAIFALDGGGSTLTGTSDQNGVILWEHLDPSVQYVLREVQAPAGYRIAEAINITVPAGQTLTQVVKNDSYRTFRLRKTDKQSGYSLRGAVFEFQRIDGSYATTGITGSDGYVEFVGDALPFGAYRVFEREAPEGYVRDTSVQTVYWDGSQDVTLYFTNVRSPGITLIKIDADNGNRSLRGAVFDVYHDGKFITTVTSDDAGRAWVNDVEPGFWEFEEIAAPAGYICDSTRHGIYVNPYDPAAFNDPVLVVSNKVKGGLKIHKVDSTDAEIGLDGVVLRVQSVSNGFDQTFITSNGGGINAPGLEPGDYLISEVATIEGYDLSSEVVPVTVRYGETATAVFKNEPHGSTTVIKVDSVTGEHLPGANIKLTNPATGQTWDVVTGTDGIATITDLESGEYYWQEQNPPNGYELNSQTYPITVVSGENSAVKIQNSPLGALEIVKVSSLDATQTLEGVKLRVQNTALAYDRTFTTGADGKILITGLLPTDYTVTEVGTIAGYFLSTETVTATVNYGTITSVIFKNDPKPHIEILKLDSQTSKPISGAVFKVIGRNTQQVYNVTTDENGKIIILDVDAGWYDVQEVTPPVGYVPDDTIHSVFADVGKPGKITITNTKMPSLTIVKQDRDTLASLAGAMFRIIKIGAPNAGEITGSPFVTDGNGQIAIPNLISGVYRVTEVEPANGYGLPTPNEWEINIIANEDYVLRIKNTRLPTLVINKINGLTFKGIPNATFDVYYVTGGMVKVGTYRTDKNGQIIIPNCQPGLYRYIETRPAQGYSKPSNPTREVFLNLGDNAYSGIGAETWSETNATVTADTPAPTPTPTAVPTPTPSTPPQSVPTPAPVIPPSVGGGLIPTLPNIPKLYATPSNAERMYN
jgi:uncharacterized surface anchored protein